jgi:hypothetical protein
MWGNTVAIHSILKKKNYKAKFSTRSILKKKSIKTILKKKTQKIEKRRRRRQFWKKKQKNLKKFKKTCGES